MNPVLKRLLLAVLRRLPGGPRLIHRRQMRNFARATQGRSRLRYFLTTTIAGSRDNADIADGFARSLNLERAPFSFPPPQRTLDDGVMVGQEIKLCLWERAPLERALAGNPAFQRFRAGAGVP